VAATVEETVVQLLEATREMASQLLALSSDELSQSSSHVCAQGHDLWALLTNDIDHETIHTGQILEARYESRDTASPMERLVAEWFVARARFIASFIGMSDEALNQPTAPDGWTYSQVAKHILRLQEHSLATISSDIAARSSE
jgi:uncharacterized damage-inducible protein DinB